jgi:threonine dehydrogenase-like Zn-dependent dehydrogenase
MMRGEFGPLPLEMQGHEGLGQVTQVGTNVAGVKVGDYIATRGEPAYADHYNVKINEWVRVPEASPKYIIEPVACGINLVEQDLRAVCDRSGPESRCLIIGSGFLGWIAYHTLLLTHVEFASIEVVGKSNVEMWQKYNGVLVDKPQYEQYNVIIDITERNTVMEQDLLAPGALWIMACEKKPALVTNFGQLLWKAITIIMPSPRAKTFHHCMKLAVDWIERGDLDVDKFWTRAYNRNTEWQQAFEDGVNRPEGYSRGYIVW